MADTDKKTKKKVGEKVTAGKDHKKATREDIEAEVEEEKSGEEVAVETAHVPEQVITVRGTGVGGTKVMTPKEHKKYCDSFKKK